MGGPLEGVKVVDCGIWMQAPFAAKILGDLGADVIKVEERVMGDPMRGVLQWQAAKLPQQADLLKHPVEIESHNQNKRSIALDLRKEKGREIVYRLVKKADVFVHNFRLGVVERLGIDYETLSQYNSKLIYTQASAFGMKGPLKFKTSFETTVMAKAGWMYHFGAPDMPPLMFKPGLGDDLVGAYVTVAMIAALFYRERTGIGQFIDISALGSLIAAATYTVNYRLQYGKEHPRRGKGNSINPLVCLYECQDNKWIYLGMMQTDRYWHDLCKVLGIEELEHDRRFDNHLARSHNASELIIILDKVFGTRPRNEWTNLLEQGGDFIFSPVNTISDLVTDPQVLENEYIIEYEHPSHGPTKVAGFPYKFSKTPASIRRHPPQHGEHTEEILLELGYTWEDILELKNLEVIL